MGSKIGSTGKSGVHKEVAYPNCQKKNEVAQMGEKRQVEQPDLNKRCLYCSSILNRLLGRDGVGDPSQVAQCPQCPNALRFCWSCLSPWQNPCEVISGHCKNQSCHMVATLLTCDQVTDPKSRVLGCPEFRACPKCHSLLMHTSGCKYVSCAGCKHSFCFICLQPSGECRKAKLYWSLSCSKPTAGRQIFST